VTYYILLSNSYNKK